MRRGRRRASLGRLACLPVTGSTRRGRGASPPSGRLFWWRKSAAWADAPCRPLLGDQGLRQPRQVAPPLLLGDAREGLAAEAHDGGVRVAGAQHVLQGQQGTVREMRRSTRRPPAPRLPNSPGGIGPSRRTPPVVRFVAWPESEFDQLFVQRHALHQGCFGIEGQGSPENSTQVMSKVPQYREGGVFLPRHGAENSRRASRANRHGRSRPARAGRRRPRVRPDGRRARP